MKTCRKCWKSHKGNIPLETGSWNVAVFMELIRRVAEENVCYECSKEIALEDERKILEAREKSSSTI